MADIFISYARADRDKIEKLASALEGEGYSVWWDRHIEGGSEFSKDIERELDAAKAVIVAWSAHSNDSRWVKDEAGIAAEAGKLVSISLDGAAPPIGFKQFHAIDLRNWKSDNSTDVFRDLARSLENRVGAMPVATAVMTSAPAEAEYARFLKPIPMMLVAFATFIFFGAGFLLLRPSPNNPSSPQLATAASADDISIAVLPFVDLSERGDQEFFADGVSEEILNVLVRIPDLKVAGRTSSFSFKGKNEDLRTISAALGVNHILEGSVRRFEDRLRITVQLIRGEDGFHLWSETFDREVTDIFDIQDEIARAVADELAVSLGLSGDGGKLVTDRTDDPAVYDNYLRAQHLYKKRGLENLDQALLLLNEATARDPNFAPAWSAIAGVYAVYEAYQDPVTAQAQHETWRAVWRAASERALALNPDDPTALSKTGSYHMAQREWGKALDYYDRAVTLAPDNADILDAFAQNLIEVGYYREAKKISQRAVDIDPLVAIYRNTLALSYQHLGEYENSHAQFRQAIANDPSLRFPYDNLWISYLLLEEIGEVKKVIELGIATGVYPGDAFDIVDDVSSAWGDVDASRAVGDKYGGALYTALSFLNDERDRAAQGLKTVWDAAYRPNPTMFTNFGIFNLYDHPLWKEQIRRDGILDLWRTRGFPEQCKPLGADDFECAL